MQSSANRFAGLLSILALGFGAARAQAATQWWDFDTTSGLTPGTGNWETIAPGRWATNATPGSSSPVVWTNGNAATFAAGGVSVVTVNDTITAGAVSVSSGTVVLKPGSGSRTFTGPLTISGSGALQFMNSPGPIGSNVTITASGPALVISNSAVTSSGAVSLGAAAANVTNLVTDNSVWDMGGQTLTLATVGSSNLLSVAGGAIVTNATNVTVCSGAGAGNEIRVSGANTKFYASGPLTIGSTASTATNTFTVANNAYARIGGRLADGANRCIALVVTNNAVLETLDVIYFGNLAGGNSNRALVANGGVWDVKGKAFYVGYQANNNEVVIDGGAITNAGAYVPNQGFLGSLAYDNRLTVTNGGRFYYKNAADIGFRTGYRNSVVVVGGPAGASLWDNGGKSLNIGNGDIAASAAAHDNTVTIDGNGGASLTNVAQLTAGTGGSGGAPASYNSLVVTNGGQVFSTNAAGIGPDSANYYGVSNTVVVTGTNSLWNVGGQTLNIGGPSLKSTGNVLRIDMAGTVDNVGALNVYSNNNSVDFRGGTLGVTSANVTNGLLFTVGDGTQTALLKGLGGTLAFGSGLLIGNNATLKGIGIVNGGPAGVVVTSGATFSPGLGIGAITNVGNLTLSPGSTTIVEIRSNTTMGTDWDLAVVTNGTLTLGGDLKVVLNGGFVPANADTFVVMTNRSSNISGEFPAKASAYASNDLAKIVGSFSVDRSNPRTVLLKKFIGGSPGSILAIR